MGDEKNSKTKILASLVMGLNCVNSFAPMAVAVNVQPENIQAKPVKETVAEAEQYTAACYQALDVVDNAMFSTAEAGTFTDSVNTAVAVSQIIQSGGGTAGGSVQTIYAGGTIGSAYVLDGGTQIVNAGGTTIGEVVSVGGTQHIEGGSVLDAWLDGGKINLNDGHILSLAVLTNHDDSEVNIHGGTVGSLIHGTFGTVNVSGGTVSYTHLAGTNAKFNVVDGNVLNTYICSNGVMNISGGTTSVTLMGQTGGTQNISGGTVIDTALGVNNTQNVFAGKVSNTSVNGGTLAVYGNSAVVENTIIDAGSIFFNGAGANYNLTGNFVARGGTVDLTKNADGTTQTPATYETLTIDNLSGNGTTFLMNTDLNSETNGDKIVVLAAAPNTGGTIQIYDKSLVDGTNVVGAKKLLLVTDNSGATSWTGKSLDTGGLWVITPDIIKDGNDWYLSLPDKSILHNDVTKTNIGFTNAAYGAWRNAATDDTLRMRLGDLRYNDAEEGVWARTKAGKMDASGFSGSYQMYQVGMDKKLANTVYGVAVDHMIGSNDYLDGNGKNSMTNLSLYATNYHPSGVYSDVVVKVGKYRSDLNVNSTNDAADYNAWGYSASYEIGKTIAKENGFFIEPEAQFILGKLQGADYTSNKGINVDRDGSTSFLGRLGFVAGRKLSNAGDYYFKASVWREFAGSGDMNLSAVNSYGQKELATENVDHKDTWFELGLGGNVKLAKMTHLYGDVVKTFGADIQKKWQVNAGVRWEF